MDDAVAILLADDQGNFQWVPGPAARKLPPPLMIAAAELLKASVIDSMRGAATAPPPQPGITPADAALLNVLKKRGRNGSGG